jgi:heterodisulfide reductase subunit C
MVRRFVPTSSFVKEVSSMPGGEVVSKCIQCGICTASCAVASVSDRYSPRVIVQKMLLGNRDAVLASDQPWLCMACRMCESRCQEGISLADVFHAIRLLAVREGRVPPVFRRTARTILQDGWMLEGAASDLVEEDREDLGLNPSPTWNNTFSTKIRSKYFAGGNGL